MTFRRGRRLGLDIGTVRVGVATSDPDGILATPYEVVYRYGGDNLALRRIVEIAAEIEAIEIVAGDPTSLDGTARASAAKAHKFARKLSQRTDVPIRFIDERFTTTQAHALLQSAGKTSRQRRETVDAAAAVLILQTAIDQEKQAAQAAQRAAYAAEPDQTPGDE